MITTLDEIIAHERELVEENKRKAEWYTNNPEVWNDGGKKKTECLKLYKEHEQYVVWLEELKEYRAIGTVEECRNSVLDIIKAYNKGIDDFANSLLSNDVIDKTVVRRICIQLKKGEK